MSGRRARGGREVRGGGCMDENRGWRRGVWGKRRGCSGHLGMDKWDGNALLLIQQEADLGEDRPPHPPPVFGMVNWWGLATAGTQICNFVKESIFRETLYVLDTLDKKPQIFDLFHGGVLHWHFQFLMSVVLGFKAWVHFRGSSLKREHMGALLTAHQLEVTAPPRVPFVTLVTPKSWPALTHVL